MWGYEGRVLNKNIKCHPGLGSLHTITSALCAVKISKYKNSVPLIIIIIRL